MDQVQAFAARFAFAGATAALRPSPIDFASAERASA
jgi:hypothetical protein